jgi:hypothetical protein
MKRFFAKIGRFFWSWGFLKFVIVLTALLVLFYVEEDWRAQHAWADLKTKWEAKGISFDPRAYIPKPIPDDQNLAAIPLFKVGGPHEIAALHEISKGELPSAGHWQRGLLPDMPKIRTALAKAYADAFPKGPALTNAVEQLDAIYPFLAELRAASAVRSLCLFKQDYRIEPPWARPLGLLTAQIKVSQILNLHAIMALADHQPDLALDDLKTNFNLMSGMRRSPELIGSLVGIGMNAIGNDGIYYGLALHAWNDVQLGEIQGELGQIDYLQNYQEVMRAEAIASVAPNFDFAGKRTSFALVDYIKQFPHSPIPLSAWVDSLWPSGWFLQNKTRTVSALLTAADAANPQAHRIFSEEADKTENAARASGKRWDGNAPWKIFFTMATPPILEASVNFAHAQVYIDEARIACALERFRLKQGAYPALLDALVPAYLNELPHDIINGQPYHYRLRPEGTYLFYSVGWNLSDEGGQIVYKKDEANAPDFKQGDWVWPTPK